MVDCLIGSNFFRDLRGLNRELSIIDIPESCIAPLFEITDSSIPRMKDRCISPLSNIIGGRLSDSFRKSFFLRGFGVIRFLNTFFTPWQG